MKEEFRLTLNSQLIYCTLLETCKQNLIYLVWIDRITNFDTSKNQISSGISTTRSVVINIVDHFNTDYMVLKHYDF